jgi:hypothetical protein
VKVESRKLKAESRWLLRHDRCVGLRLWQWNRTQWILWFAPKGAEIEDHVHLQLRARVKLLLGRMVWRCDAMDEYDWCDMVAKTITAPARWMNIHCGQCHGATALTASVFLVRETWIGTGPMTSAARDFHPTH